jgi:hypothetical protein
MDQHLGFVGTWREGWLMYDGTIVVLYAKPGLNGDAYYTHKAKLWSECSGLYESPILLQHLLIIITRLAIFLPIYASWIIHIVTLDQHMTPLHLKALLLQSIPTGFLKGKNLLGVILHMHYPLAPSLFTKNLHLSAQKMLYLTKLYPTFMFAQSIAWVP